MALMRKTAQKQNVKLVRRFSESLTLICCSDVLPSSGRLCFSSRLQNWAQSCLSCDRVNSSCRPVPVCTWEEVH